MRFSTFSPLLDSTSRRPGQKKCARGDNTSRACGNVRQGLGAGGCIRADNGMLTRRLPLALSLATMWVGVCQADPIIGFRAARRPGRARGQAEGAAKGLRALIGANFSVDFRDSPARERALPP